MEFLRQHCSDVGIGLNYIGILKMIDWLQNEHTPYIFPARFLVPEKLKKQ